MKKVANTIKNKVGFMEIRFSDLLFEWVIVNIIENVIFK